MSGPDNDPTPEKDTSDSRPGFIVKERRKDWACRPCGAQLVSLYGPVTMCGGFVTTMCADCRNEWHEFFLPHPLRRDWSVKHAQLQGCIAVNRMMADACKDLETTEKLVYHLGKEWVEQKEAARAEDQ